MLSRLKNISQGHWPLFLMGSLSSLANLILPIVLVRILSPEDIGLYKTFFLYLMILPFIALSGGPVNALYYWIGFDKHLRDDYIKNSWAVTIMFSSVLFVMGFFFLSFSFVFSLPLSTSQLIMLIICSFLSAPSGFYGEVCVAKGETTKGAILALSFELIKVAGFIFCAFKTRDITMIFYFYTLLMILSFIFMTSLASMNKVLTWRPDWEVMKRIMRYSVPISISSGIIFVIDKLDLLILSGIISSESFALYSLGCLIIPPLFLLEMSVQKIMIPRISALFVENNLEGIALEFRKSVGDIGFLVVPAFFGLCFFSDAILAFLYTHAYSGAGIYLKVFAFSYLLLLIPHDAVLRATGKTDVIMKFNFLTLILACVILLFSAHHFSTLVTLMLSVVVKFIPKLYGLTASRKIINSSLIDLIPWRQLGEYAVVSALLTGICFSAKGYFPDEKLWLLSSIVLFAVTYLGLFGLVRKRHHFIS